MKAILTPTLGRWFTPEFVRRNPEFVEKVSKTLLSCDRHVHASMWDMIATLDVTPRLGDLHTPTLVLVGEDDPSTPVATARVIAQRIRGSELVILPKASHMTPLEIPDLVNEKLLNFLDWAEYQSTVRPDNWRAVQCSSTHDAPDGPM